MKSKGWKGLEKDAGCGLECCLVWLSKMILDDE